MNDLETRLQKARLQLSEMTSKLLELVNSRSIKGVFKIKYATIFIEYKQTKFDGKYPSDEAAKQLTLADPRMAGIIEDYESFLVESDIYIEVSRNVRKELDSLKSTYQEDNSSNTHY